MENNKQSPCPTCGGTGQISFFQGESRFLLTDEECPACSGLGYILEEKDTNPQHKELTDDE